MWDDPPRSWGTELVRPSFRVPSVHARHAAVADHIGDSAGLQALRFSSDALRSALPLLPLGLRSGGPGASPVQASSGASSAAATPGVVQCAVLRGKVSTLHVARMR